MAEDRIPPNILIFCASRTRRLFFGHRPILELKGCDRSKQVHRLCVKYSVLLLQNNVFFLICLTTHRQLLRRRSFCMRTK